MNPDPEHLPPSARLAAIVESSNDAIVSKDLNGIITSWNRGAEKVFGYTANEVIGRSITILIPPDHLEEEPRILDSIRRGVSIEHYETIRRHKDGRLLDISLTVSPILDSDGRVIGASKVARDITEAKRSIAEITKLAAIVESSADAIISKDLNGIITSWNKGAEMVFGYTAEEVVGKPITILMPPERADEEPGILGRIRKGEKVAHYETVRRRKDGRLIDISLNVSPVYDAHGHLVGASKIARDITEQKRADKAVREAETMHRLLQAQEGERQRIARDLHDHLGQKMTALRLRLQQLTKDINGDNRLRAEIDAITELAGNIDRDIGFLSWELRPTELDQLGLENALRSFVREWTDNYSIVGTFHVNADPSAPEDRRLSREAETHLYRIAQEGLNNILKHAQATSVTVLLYFRAKVVVLVIEDNGNGFDLESVARTSRGLGLSGIRERSALMNGVFELESAPGKGTTIHVRVPLEKNCAGDCSIDDANGRMLTQSHDAVS